MVVEGRGTGCKRMEQWRGPQYNASRQGGGQLQGAGASGHAVLSRSVTAVRTRERDAAVLHVQALEARSRGCNDVLVVPPCLAGM